MSFIDTPEARQIGDWMDKVAMGQYPKVFATLKFGRNPLVGTTEEDLWAVGGKETLLSAPAAMYASCEDNTNGVGQRIYVQGLGSSWELKEGWVILTGQTQARVLDADGTEGTWARIFRAYQVSGEPDPVGDVWIAEADTLTAGVPNTATKVHALVEFTDAAQQTEKAMFTIPAGYTGLFYGSQAFMAGATSGSARYCEIGIEIQSLALGADVASPAWTPWRRIDTYSVSTVSTDVEHMLLWPIILPELTNVAMRGKASATSDVIGSMEGILVPNS